jgi:hypothetical protein
LSAFGLLDQVQVGDTGPAESTRRGNLQRVGLLFLGSRDTDKNLQFRTCSLFFCLHYRTQIFERELDLHTAAPIRITASAIKHCFLRKSNVLRKYFVNKKTKLLARAAIRRKFLVRVIFKVQTLPFTSVQVPKSTSNNEPVFYFQFTFNKDCQKQKWI